MLTALALTAALLAANDSPTQDFWLSTKARISLATHDVQDACVCQHGPGDFHDVVECVTVIHRGAEQCG